MRCTGASRHHLLRGKRGDNPCEESNRGTWWQWLITAMHQDCCSLSSCLSECFYLWPDATGVLGGQMWKMDKHKKHERRSAGSLKYSGRDTDKKLPTCAANFCLLINNSSACLWLYNIAISSLKDHCAFSPTSLLFARLAYLRWHPTGSLLKYWKSFTPCLDFSFFFDVELWSIERQLPHLPCSDKKSKISYRFFMAAFCLCLMHSNHSDVSVRITTCSSVGQGGLSQTHLQVPFTISNQLHCDKQPSCCYREGVSHLCEITNWSLELICKCSPSPF